LDKNKSYPKDLRNNIPFHELGAHPLSHGIVMQAHHLISSKGAKNSGLEADLVELNYEINVVNNLVFLPSTLEGACHLNVQLHRGDHKAKIPDTKNYHRYVQGQIADIKQKINDCDKNEEKKSPIQDAMDLVSREILNEIAAFDIPLSFIYKNFKPDSGLGGCCNKKNIPDVRKALKRKSGTTPCSKEGNHLGDMHSFSEKSSNKDTITYKNTSYRLEVGK